MSAIGVKVSRDDLASCNFLCGIFSPFEGFYDLSKRKVFDSLGLAFGQKTLIEEITVL